MSKDDYIYVGHILQAIGEVEQALKAERTLIVQCAVERNIEIIGEAASNVSPSFVAAHPDIPWSKMTGMRHKIIHDYFGIDARIVWDVAENKLPTLKKQLLPLIKKE